MDNVEVVDLPSNVLPTVSGKKSVICRGADGFLYCVTASGAQRLMTVDDAHEIGSHAIQFFGERTPAARYGGTWEIDSEYAGRVIIGSGGSYTFGAKGGEENHTQTIPEMPKHRHYVLGGGEELSLLSGSGPNYQIEFHSNGGITQLITDEVGQSTPFNIMQPYFVQNIWKRVA